MKDTFESRLLRLILGLPFFIAGYLLVSRLWSLVALPYTANEAGGVISYTTRNEINPLNDYARLALLVVFSSGLYLYGYTRGYRYFISVTAKLCSSCGKFLGEILAGERQLQYKNPLHGRNFFTDLTGRFRDTSDLVKNLLFAVAVVAVFLNLSWDNLTGILADGFHDGEMTGYLPVIKSEDGIFKNAFIIHGFGRNILPSVFADEVGNQSNRIYFVRLYNLITEVFALLFLWLSVSVALLLAFQGRAGTKRILVVSLAVLSVLKTTYFWNIEITGRDTVLFLQVFLLLVILYNQDRRLSKSILLISLFAGFLAPVSFLNAYDRAIVGVLVTFTVAVILVLILKKKSIPVVSAILSGGVLSAVLIYFTLGGDEIRSAFEQMLYWSKYAGLIWDMELKDSSVVALTLFALQNVMIIAVSVIFLVAGYRKQGGYTHFLKYYGGFIAIFAMSLVFLRMSADRSDTRHLFDASLPAVLLLVFLVSALIIKFGITGDSVEVKTIENRKPLVSLLFPAFLVMAILINNPVTSAVRAIKHIDNYGAADSVIIAPGYTEAVKVMTPYLKSEKYIYPLTSEGIWFFLFNLKSPTRFHQLLYARTDGFQLEVVDALEAKKPGYVILNPETMFTSIDSTTVFNTNKTVARYVLKNYRPFKMVQSQWFWKRDTTPFVFDTTEQGKVFATQLSGTKKRDIRISGELNDVAEGSENSTFYLSDEKTKSLISVSRGVTNENGKTLWFVDVPTATLSSGDNFLRVWLLSDKGDTLYPVGSEIKVRID